MYTAAGIVNSVKRACGAVYAAPAVCKAAQDAITKVRDAAKATNTSPSKEQIAAGNYEKGKFNLHGLRFTIENPKGSTRSGTSSTGKEWSSTMTADYGYLRGGYTGRDVDPVDVFIGPRPQSELVFVVNQCHPGSGRFDEHKAIIGCDNEAEARELYLSNYEKGWKGLDSVAAYTMHDFKRWLDSGDLSKRACSHAAMCGFMKLANPDGWTGVDLDGTLAVYEKYDGPASIGAPVPAMVKRVKGMLEDGEDVRIFTARVHKDSGTARAAIRKWCEQHLGKILPVTNRKDPEMKAFIDDRAIAVQKNTGKILGKGVDT